MTNPEDIKKLVGEITDFVNSFNHDTPAFIEHMCREHRTLQQSFTKLCLKWIEHVSGGDYNFDGRNKASHEIAYKLIREFVKENGSLPSQWIPLI